MNLTPSISHASFLFLNKESKWDWVLPQLILGKKQKTISNDTKNHLFLVFAHLKCLYERHHASKILFEMFFLYCEVPQYIQDFILNID